MPISPIGDLRNTQWQELLDDDEKEQLNKSSQNQRPNKIKRNLEMKKLCQQSEYHTHLKHYQDTKGEKAQTHMCAVSTPPHPLKMKSNSVKNMVNCAVKDHEMYSARQQLQEGRDYFRRSAHTNTDVQQSHLVHQCIQTHHQNFLCQRIRNQGSYGNSATKEGNGNNHMINGASRSDPYKSAFEICGINYSVMEPRKMSLRPHRDAFNKLTTDIEQTRRHRKLPCMSLLRTGTCQYATECRYSHEYNYLLAQHPREALFQCERTKKKYAIFLDVCRAMDTIRPTHQSDDDHFLTNRSLTSRQSHRSDVSVDIDNMSYEELLALEERNGKVVCGTDRVIYDRFPLRKYTIFTNDEGNAQDRYKEEKECVICGETFQQLDDIRTTPCRHDFHDNCLWEWLKSNKMCPYRCGDVTEI